jgi:hypothetical protein
MGNRLSWKEHVDGLMSKLGLACYAIRAVKPVIGNNNLFLIFSSCYDMYNFVV